MDNFIWVVRDPGLYSEFIDICWQSTAVGFADYVVGTGSNQVRRENTVFHTSKEAATADANARLERRNKQSQTR